MSPFLDLWECVDIGTEKILYLCNLPSPIAFPYFQTDWTGKVRSINHSVFIRLLQKNKKSWVKIDIKLSTVLNNCKVSVSIKILNIFTHYCLISESWCHLVHVEGNTDDDDMLPLMFSFLLLLPFHFQSYVLTTVLCWCHIEYMLITNRVWVSSKVVPVLIKRIKVEKVKCSAKLVKLI